MIDDKAIYFGDNYDYVIMPSLDAPLINDQSIKGKDVESKVEHLDFYYKIMELFNKFILIMVRNGINFDHVSLSTSAGIVCKKDFYDRYKAADTELKKNLMKDLFGSVYKDVVPVTFTIDFENTGYEGKNLSEMNLKPELIEELRKLSISGMIFYNRFLAEMRENGFTVMGMNGPIDKYSDYLMNIVDNNGEGVWYSVISDYNYNKVEDKRIVNF